MYAINEGLAKINGVPVETFEREVIDGNTALRAEAGTTGYKGGCCRDNGGRTYLCIDCLCGDFHFSPVTDDEKNVVGIEIACCGDANMEADLPGVGLPVRGLEDRE